MKRHDLRAAITGRILPAFIALALLTTCRNGGDPSRTGTKKKAIVRADENDEGYGPNIIIGIEDFPAFDFEKPKEDTVCVVTHRMPSFPGGYDKPDGFHPPKHPLSEQSRAGKYPGSDFDQMRYR